MVGSLLLLAGCFFAIWLGAGLVVRNLEALAKSIRISRFIVSFFLLGFATSVSEFSVAINSLLYSRPQVSVGNLMGGSMYILLFVIPLISLLGGDTSLVKMLPKKFLLVFTILVLVPLASALDGVISITEGIIFILIYVVYIQSRSKGLIESFMTKEKPKTNFKNSGFLVLKIIVGIGIVFFMSNVVVQEVISLSTELGISAFLLSVLIISVGTNIPELSIAVRSLIAKKKDIAIGNYIGSVALNTPTLGVLTVLNGEAIVLSNVATPILIVFIIGVLIFYKACRSGSELSRKEALILMILYISFIVVEGGREYLLD